MRNPLFPQVQRRVRPLQRNFLTDKSKDMKTWKLALHGPEAAKYHVQAETRQEAADKLRARFPNLKIVAHREVREVKND